MTGLSLDEPIEPLNPFDENGFAGLSADTWGYRRPPVTLARLVAPLPSPDDAYRRWLVDPSAAAAAAEPLRPGGMPVNAPALDGRRSATR